MKTKIVYVVVSTDDDIYLEQTWASAYSLKLYTPDAHIVILSDEDTAENITSSDRNKILSVVDEIIPVKIDGNYSNKEKSRWLKTNMRALISGDFLFIDSDTVICQDVSDADNFTCSIGGTYDFNSQMIPNWKDVKKHVRKIFGRELKRETNYYNSGVLFVKDDDYAHEFFRQWHENWKISRSKGVPIDQTALIKTCDDLGNLYDIGGVWHCQALYTIQYLYDAKILHFFNAHYDRGRPTFSPFFEKEVYMDIKVARGITPGVDDLIKNCKRRFDSPTIPICHEDVIIWRSTPYRYLHWVYLNNKKLFNVTVFMCRVLNKLLGVNKRKSSDIECGRTEVMWDRDTKTTVDNSESFRSGGTS